MALTHNDELSKPDYLTKLVEYSEAHPRVGAVQGVVTKFGCDSLVDSAGFMLNELFSISSISTKTSLFHWFGMPLQFLS